MQELLYEERDRTAFLTLNRPQVRNCLSMKLSDKAVADPSSPGYELLGRLAEPNGSH
jgi:hypothetical protein